MADVILICTILYFDTCMSILQYKRHLKCYISAMHLLENGTFILFKMIHANAYCINTLRRCSDAQRESTVTILIDPRRTKRLIKLFIKSYLNSNLNVHPKNGF